MFPSELLARAIEADRTREKERAARDHRMLHPTPVSSAPPDRPEAQTAVRPRPSRAGIESSCEPV
jgi:hypothetical protein